MVESPDRLFKLYVDVGIWEIIWDMNIVARGGVR